MNLRLVAAALIALAACSTPAPAAAPQVGALATSAADPYQPQPYVKLTHADWAKDAVIYQINTRQFTQEGTFAAAQAQLPRLAELGVDILWLMPIHPIGETNRKGSLGSPYSVKDYYAINAQFGTLDDFKAFVDAAHARGMKVIIDWVANHSAWDNPLVAQHPDWYATDWKGDFHPTPWTDWADIIDFDYSNPELREYMTQAMVYWVKEIGVDGFRCDVAGFVPLDFWNEARRQLDEIKPVFMLAEWEARDLHQRAFDASYGWEWKEAAQDVAAGRGNAERLRGFYANDLLTWPEDAYRMLYTSNHDQNAWEGTPFEFYGDAYKAMAALQFVSRGIPVIYNGQEAGNTQRLAFFEKDPIVWEDSPLNDHFKQLIALKTNNPALWNGAAGGMTIPVSTDNPDQILSFAREKDGNRVVVFFNLSPQMAEFKITDGPVGTDSYRLLDSSGNLHVAGETRNGEFYTQHFTIGFGARLTPWAYIILLQDK